MLYPDDVAILVGVVVARDGRMWEVELEFPAGLANELQMSESHVVSWRDDVERIARQNKDYVRAAVALLSEGG